MQKFNEYVMDILRAGVDKKASDIHLISDHPVCYRIAGELRSFDESKILDSSLCREVIKFLVSDDQFLIADSGDEINIMINIEEIGRFRLLIYKNGGNLGATLRIIPIGEVPTFEELGLPEVLNDLIDNKSGLILITGPNGSGKTTTLASIMSNINKKRKSHIISFEDPVEHIITPEKSIIRQREISHDSASFDQGLRYCLRADPDVVILTETRTLASISSILTIAETGHLAIAGLHTRTTSETIERTIDVFPPYQQSQIRKQLASVLLAIISQRLVPHDGQLKLISEVLVNIDEVKRAILEDDMKKIAEILRRHRSMYSGSDQGIQSFAQSMEKLNLKLQNKDNE